MRLALMILPSGLSSRRADINVLLRVVGTGYLHVQLLRIRSKKGYPCIDENKRGYFHDAEQSPPVPLPTRAPIHLIRCIPVGFAVFGNSETFKRLPLPAILENLSRVLKASLVLFWGRWGLPVPFKVRSIDQYTLYSV